MPGFIPLGDTRKEFIFMSVKGKILASTVALAVTGGVGLAAAPGASAASNACGSTCMSLYTTQFGTGYVMAVRAPGATTGTAVTLTKAGLNTGEDFVLENIGTVSDLNAQGYITSQVNLEYGSDEAYVFQFAPGGVDSGLCAGVASTPAAGTKVTLQPCGENGGTLWVYDSADAVGRTIPLINGAGTNFSMPYSLTAPSNTGQLTTQELTSDDGVIESKQLWESVYGAL
jgi:hypothetical protein